MNRSPGLLLLALALLAAAPAQAACVFEKRAEAPLRLRDGYPLVPATIGGTPVTFLLDTGAQGMLITPEAAALLGLPPDPGVTTRMFGTGGARDVGNVILQGLRIGGAAAPSRSVPVASLPGAPVTEPPLAGLLGAPLLAAYDLDLDVPGGRMALYDAAGCGAAMPPVPQPATVLPLEVSPEGEAFVPVEINGQSLLALLDTGSRATLLTEQAARRLGLGGPVSANTARGVDGEALPLRHHRVREMRVGADVVMDAPVSVAPLQLGRGDMLLGLDYLGQRRVWISYASGRVVIGLTRR